MAPRQVPAPQPEVGGGGRWRRMLGAGAKGVLLAAGGLVLTLALPAGAAALSATGGEGGGAVHVAGAAWAAPSPPGGLVVSPSTARPGDSVTVTADGLQPPRIDWQVAVCGDGGFGTSAACDLASATSGAGSDSGHFVVVLQVEIPPSPCPCVVQATPLAGVVGAGPQTYDAPITILGAPGGPATAAGSSENPSGLQIVSARLRGSSWEEWFGAHPHRTLVLVLRNEGDNVIPSTPFVLRAGHGWGGGDWVITPPNIPVLQPGQEMTYRIPVRFPDFSFGSLSVTGVLGSIGQTESFSVHTNVYPWGLLALALVLAQAVLLLVRNRLRRRYQAPSPPPSSPLPEGDGGTTDPAAGQAVPVLEPVGNPQS
jgi:hypothetical protein